MHVLLATFVGLAIGVVLLGWAADRFIGASIEIAEVFKMSPVMIGMVLVGFGTSFPEFVVSALAAAKGEAGLSIGNVIGSNIANIGMCLGIAAFICPLKINSRIVTKDYFVLFLISLFVGVFILSGSLTRVAGVSLLLGLVANFVWLYWSNKKGKIATDALAIEFEKELSPEKVNLVKTMSWWFFSLFLVFVSSEILIRSAVTMAQWFHVSNLFIGLTVVAIGTSLPELAATIVAARRNEPDIAVGNVIGSNIFNLLGVLAMPALISPTRLATSVIYRDYPIMLGFTLAVWLISILPPHKNQLTRISGSVLFIGYVVYLSFVILTR